MLKLKFTCSTNGRGFWSRTKKEVRILGVELAYVSQDLRHGELWVIFNTADWDTRKESVIYTDSKFLKQLKKNLRQLGFSKQAVETIGYSEYGMQGVNYVSFDVSEDMVAELLFNGAAGQEVES